MSAKCSISFLLLFFVTSCAIVARNNATKNSPLSSVSRFVMAEDLNKETKIIGELGFPLGSVVSVSGTVMESKMKRDEGVPILSVKSISGRLVEKSIDMQIFPLVPGGWAKEVILGMECPSDGPVVGMTYTMVGYENGGYGGLPEDVLRKRRLSSLSYHFATWFVVLEFEKEGSSP